MIKRHTIFALLLVLSLVAAQNVLNANPSVTPTIGFDAAQGAMYRHIYVKMVRITSATTTATLALTQSIPSGIFDDSQQIFTASSLIRFIGTPGQKSPTQHQLILKVASIIVNTAKTSFTMNLQFNTSDFQQFSTYTQLAFQVILMGSKFNQDAPQWLTNSAPLTGGFVRNGDLVDVADDDTSAAANIRQFDFTGTQGEVSPFAYQPDSTAGCGVRKVGTAWRIQGQTCQRPIFMSFITGFQHKVAGATVVNSDLQMSSFIVPDSTTSTVATPASPNQVASTDDTKYIYQTNSNTDTIYGLFIKYEQTAASVSQQLDKIQLSLVFIAVKESAIPQTIYRDSFTAAVGVLGEQLSSTDVTNTRQSLYDPYRSTLLNTGNYFPNPTDPTLPDSAMGHSFCGLQKIIGRNPNLIIANRINRQILRVASNPYTNNVQQVQVGCIFLASNTPCLSDQTWLTVNGQTNAVTKSATTYTVTTPNANGNPALATTTGLSPYTTPLYSYTLTGLNGKTTQTKITLDFINAPADKTQFFYLLEIDVPSNDLAAGQLQFTLNLAGQTFTPVAVSDQQSYYLYSVHVPAGTTTIPVTLTLDATNPNPNVINTYSRVFYPTTVLTPSLQCLSNCPQQPGFTVGTDPYSDPPQCIYCDSALHQEFFAGECQCFDYYYPDTSVTTQLSCIACAFQLCTQCTATQCTVCVDHATYVSLGTLQYNCICDNGYYKNGSICSPCPIGCTKCTSPTACTECNTTNSIDANGFQTRLAISANCVCKTGLYEVANTAVCQPCQSPCATCSGSATFCTSCLSSSVVLNATAGTCSCPAGTFLLNSQCAPCSPICATCNVGSTYCVSCPANAQLAATNQLQFKTCKCVPPYVQIQNTCVDSTCPLVTPYCSNCAYDPSVRQSWCYGCVGDRMLVSGLCVCKPGFYTVNYSNGTFDCLPCGSGCQTCTSSTSCSICATGSTNNLNGTCTCIGAKYLTTIAQGIYCIACPSSCATCTSDSVCTSCNSGYELNTLNKCVCAGATYPSADGTQCLPCPSGCTRCSSGTVCLACQSGLTYDNTTFQCQLICSTGTYNGGVACLPCSSGCATCRNEFLCDKCIDGSGLVLYAGSCRSSCPTTTYSLNNICYLCPSQCKTCSSATVCFDCNQGFILYNSQCLATCPAGTYLSGGSCRPCSANCVSCLGSASLCTRCADPWILYNNTCYSTCPVAVVNNVCTNVCPTGKYLSGNQCLDCSSSCLGCSGNANNCTVCLTSYSLNGQCVDTCPDGYYYGAGFCGKCDPTCKTCQNLPQNCKSCQDGFLLSSGSCVRACGDGFYIDSATSSCLPCRIGCRQCTATACLACSDPTQLPNGLQCRTGCPSGATLINGRCVCSIGVLSNNMCVTSCPDGFYANSQRVCQRCTSPCLTCSGSAQSCSSCVSGFTFDPARRTCTRIGTCDYGLQLVNGVCVRICTSINMYYYRGGCVYSCPANTRPDANNACIDYVNPTFCTFPLFQQGSACVSRCNSGFWPNDVTRMCQPCSSNCAQCFSQTFCLQCASGYFLNNDQTACITSQQCPTGQYQYGGLCYVACPIGTFLSSTGPICIRACPERTYLDGNWCYSTCKTPLYTADACVNTCPANTRCFTTGL